MLALALTLLALPFALTAYAYVLYPALLRALTALRDAPPATPDPAEWPLVSVTIPAYNEVGSIRATIEGVLATDYPADRRQVVVVSDASTDGTDDVVREYASRGVELLRMPVRGGKTAAENAVGAVVRGSIVVNMDATIRLRAGSLKALVRAFQDPTVGVASGRDVSVGAADAEANAGESGYVGYEMWVRSLETRLGSIVGASGCFFGIRRELHGYHLPEGLSRDFASALVAEERGYRAVSVEDAVCLVPRTVALDNEFRRKVRTMARGLETLWYKRHLMNPARHGLFAFMLVSHKLCRWLVYPALPAAGVGLLLAAAVWEPARWLVAVAALGTMLGVVGMRWPAGRRPPRPLALFGFALAATLAGLLAWRRALGSERSPIWEPTRRPA